MPPVKGASGRGTRYPSCDAHSDAKPLKKTPSNVDAYARAVKGQGYSLCQYDGSGTRYGRFKDSPPGGAGTQPGGAETRTKPQPQPKPKEQNTSKPAAPDTGAPVRMVGEPTDTPAWVPWVAIGGPGGLLGLLGLGYTIKRVRDKRRQKAQNAQTTPKPFDDKRYAEGREFEANFKKNPAYFGPRLNWDKVEAFIAEADRRGEPVDQDLRDALALRRPQPDGAGQPPESAPQPSTPKPPAPKTVPDSTPPKPAATADTHPTTPDSQPAVPSSKPRSTTTDALPGSRVPDSVVDPHATGDDKTEPGVTLGALERGAPSSEGKARAEKTAAEKAAAEKAEAEAKRSAVTAPDRPQPASVDAIAQNFELINSKEFQDIARAEAQQSGNADYFAVHVKIDAGSGRIIASIGEKDADVTLHMTKGMLIAAVEIRAPQASAFSGDLRTTALRYNDANFARFDTEISGRIQDVQKLREGLVPLSDEAIKVAVAPYERMLEANKEVKFDGVQIVDATRKSETSHDTLVDSSEPAAPSTVAQPEPAPAKTETRPEAKTSEPPRAPETSAESFRTFEPSERDPSGEHGPTDPAPARHDSQSAIATRADVTWHSATEESDEEPSTKPRPKESPPNVIIMDDDSRVGAAPSAPAQHTEMVSKPAADFPAADVTMQSVREPGSQPPPPPESEPQPETVARDVTIPGLAVSGEEEPRTVRVTPTPPGAVRLADNVGEAFRLVIGEGKTSTEGSVDIEHPDRLIYAMEVMKKLKDVSEFKALPEDARLTVAINTAVRMSEAYRSKMTPDMAIIVNEVAKHTKVSDGMIAAIASINPSESMPGPEQIHLGRIGNLREELASIPAYRSQASSLLPRALRDYLTWQGEEGADSSPKTRRGGKSMWLPPVEWLVERSKASAPRPAAPAKPRAVPPPPMPASPVAPKAADLPPPPPKKAVLPPLPGKKSSVPPPPRRETPPPPPAERAKTPPPPARPATPPPPPVARRASPPPPAAPEKHPFAGASEGEIEGVLGRIGEGAPKPAPAKPAPVTADPSVAPFFAEILAQRKREPGKRFMFTTDEVEELVARIKRAPTEHPDSRPDVGETAGTLVEWALPEDDDAVKTHAIGGADGWSYGNAQRISYAIDILTKYSQDANFTQLNEIQRVAMALKMGGLVDIEYKNGRVPDMNRITETAFASKKLSAYRPAMSVFAPGAMSASEAAPLSLSLWTVMQELKGMEDYSGKESATKMQFDALTAVITWRAGEGLEDRSADGKTVLDVPPRDWVRQKFVPAAVSITEKWDDEPATQPRGRTVSAKVRGVAEATAEPQPVVSETFIHELYRANRIYEKMAEALGDERMKGRERRFAEAAYLVAEHVGREMREGKTSDANAFAHQVLKRSGMSRSATMLAEKADLNESVDAPPEVKEGLRLFSEHTATRMARMQEFQMLEPSALRREVAVAALSWNQTRDASNSMNVIASDGVEMSVPTDHWLKGDRSDKPAAAAHKGPPTLPPPPKTPTPDRELSAKAEQVAAATRDRVPEAKVPVPESLPKFPLDEPKAEEASMPRFSMPGDPSKTDLALESDATVTSFDALMRGGQSFANIHRVVNAIEIMKALRGNHAFDLLRDFTRCNIAFEMAKLIDVRKTRGQPVDMGAIMQKAYERHAPGKSVPAVSIAEPIADEGRNTLVSQTVGALAAQLREDPAFAGKGVEAQNIAITSVMLWESLPKDERRKIDPKGTSPIPPIKWVEEHVVRREGPGTPSQPPVAIASDANHEPPTVDVRRSTASDRAPTFVRPDPEEGRPTHVMRAASAVDSDPDGTRKTLIARPAPKLTKSTPPPPKVGSGKAGERIGNVAKDTGGKAQPVEAKPSLEPMNLNALTPTPSEAAALTVPAARQAPPAPSLFSRGLSAMWRTVTFIPRKIGSWIASLWKGSGRNEVLKEAEHRDRYADEGMPARFRHTKPSAPEQPEIQLTRAEIDAVVKEFKKHGISANEVNSLMKEQKPFVQEVIHAWRGQAPELRGKYKGGFPQFFVAYADRAGRIAARGDTVVGGKKRRDEEKEKERAAQTRREGVMKPPTKSPLPAPPEGLPLPETVRERKGK